MRLKNELSLSFLLILILIPSVSHSQTCLDLVTTASIKNKPALTQAERDRLDAKLICLPVISPGLIVPESHPPSAENSQYMVTQTRFSEFHDNLGELVLGLLSGKVRSPEITRALQQGGSFAGLVRKTRLETGNTPSIYGTEDYFRYHDYIAVPGTVLVRLKTGRVSRGGINRIDGHAYTSSSDTLPYTINPAEIFQVTVFKSRVTRDTLFSQLFQGYELFFHWSPDYKVLTVRVQESSRYSGNSPESIMIFRYNPALKRYELESA